MESFVSAGVIGLSLGTQYALLSLGFTLIFGILGVINFAHGGFYVLGGYLAFTLTQQAGLPYVVAVPLAALACAIVGYLVELILLERHVDNHLTTMMITVGLYLVITTGVTVVYGPQPADFPFPVDGAWRAGEVFVPYSNLIVLAVCALVIAGVYGLMYRTRFGIALRAMADHRQVAIAQGLRPIQMFPLAFAVATALAGLTGALVTPILALEPHIGESVLAKSFMVVILGGLGNLTGATIAAFVVGIVEAYSSVYLGGSKGALALFALVMLILVVRPNGLMGREARKA